jgi:hypothetical protein
MALAIFDSGNDLGIPLGGDYTPFVPFDPIYGAPGGGVGGSITLNPTPNQVKKALFDKINLVNDSCLRKIVDKIGASTLNDSLSKLFVDNFINLGSSDNIVFKENPFIPNQGPAWSFADPLKPNSWVVEINPSVLANSSSEFITSVIAHEIVHYYIEVYFQSMTVSISSNYNHHYNMFSNWVNSISNMLRSIHPSLSQSNAISLALGGMADVLGSKINDSGFPSSFNNFALANYHISISEANLIRRTYELGLSGTSKCN